MENALLWAAFDLASLLPFAVFGACGAVAWLALEWMSASKSRSEQRLDEIRDPGARARKAEGRMTASDAMSKMLAKASPLANSLKPKTEKEENKLRLKMMQSGFRHESAPSIFLSLKFLSLLTGFLLGGGSLLFRSEWGMSAFLWAGFIAGAMFYLPDIGLWFVRKKRKEAIFLGLPDALDLMVVCVEAGLGLDQAMRKVAEEMKKSYRVIAEEFGLCNMHMQMGRTRSAVLHELGERSGVDDVRALASIIVQADRFGSSIAQALRVQSDSMRVRRRQMAEEKAAKTAVKLIFPLVIFIFPGIFVILVGPAAITMMNEMFPAMQGKG
ncbi:type II secretion system F family protein [Lignipirellula cremea]|uniref:Bacterial type II secretion system protein F domain protein n=1 Tax=Lignipirellula cremea TaxID=2528010 RepID=A0A518E1J5_9BACT|nr:type II secretion system F family protein [Lignipirellula cremea]QDU97967.1 Bacterial type II secretion system protein F domain protein [Lignipirellula cremea]